jgi:hypothetical protein
MVVHSLVKANIFWTSFCIIDFIAPWIKRYLINNELSLIKKKKIGNSIDKTWKYEKDWLLSK